MPRPPSVPFLERCRNADGGFGPSEGALSEPEAAALAAIALDDPDARAWLLSHQGEDGGFGQVVGSVTADDTAVVSLALPPGAPLERALDHLESYGGQKTGSSEIIPHSPDVAGWPWTHEALGWTEPTAWGLLALRRLRPAATARIDDGVAYLRDRECSGGGWNYGTREAFGVALEPFVQTTATAVIAVRGADVALARRGVEVLRARWRSEASGPLSLATAAVALRLTGDRAATEIADALRAAWGGFDDLGSVDAVAAAWATIALGPGIERMDVA